MKNEPEKQKAKKPKIVLPCPHCGLKPKGESDSKICGRCGKRTTPFMTAEEAAAYLGRAPGTLLTGGAGTGCLRLVRPGRKNSVHGRVLLVYAQVLRHAEIEIRDGGCDGSCKDALKLT